MPLGYEFPSYLLGSIWSHYLENVQVFQEFCKHSVKHRGAFQVAFMAVNEQNILGMLKQF